MRGRGTPAIGDFRIWYRCVSSILSSISKETTWSRWIIDFNSGIIDSLKRWPVQSDVDIASLYRWCIIGRPLDIQLLGCHAHIFSKWTASLSLKFKYKDTCSSIILTIKIGKLRWWNEIVVLSPNWMNRPLKLYQLVSILYRPQAIQACLNPITGRSSLVFRPLKLYQLVSWF
jgi:hypothetical protein